MSTLEEYIIDQLSKDMAKNMDLHVLAEIYLSTGWIEIFVNPWIHSSNKKVTAWCDKNFQDSYIQVGNRWIIKDSKDATMFALRWGA